MYTLNKYTNQINLNGNDASEIIQMEDFSVREVTVRSSCKCPQHLFNLEA